MKSRITVAMAGHEFTILSEEKEAYVRGVAEEVDKNIQTVMVESHLSLSDAAVLTALNFADRSRKAHDSADHLRTQVKTYLDETQKLKAELAEARREASRLKNSRPAGAPPAPNAARTAPPAPDEARLPVKP